MMEDKQMRKYPFFRKIGAFAINRENSKSTIRSLRYAIESLQQTGSSLFIYPEGKITPSGSELKFEDGLSWLSHQLPEVDVVPIGIYMHTIRSYKPELHLHVGAPVPIKQDLSKDEQSRRFEEALEMILADLQQTAGFEDSGLDRLV